MSPSGLIPPNAPPPLMTRKESLSLRTSLTAFLDVSSMSRCLTLLLSLSRATLDLIGFFLRYRQKSFGKLLKPLKWGCTRVEAWNALDSARSHILLIRTFYPPKTRSDETRVG